MKRTALKTLEEWKNRSSRKPLLLYGARQVGKTYLLKEFGRAYFENVAYFDLEKQVDVQGAFERDLSPRTIMSNLSQILGHAIDISKTLIVFDEVQASNRALASLKYFCEEMSEAYVVAAGSLLGVAVNREGYSAPVGKVDTFTLHPMTFDEFLDALGFGQMIDGIVSSYRLNEPYFLHERALELYRSYLLVGGMPEAVLAFSESNDYGSAARVQENVLDLYIADMAKYAQPYETARIIEAWKSIPAQLAKENKKFQYKTVRSGGRASQYEAALAWLETAGLVNRCVQITSGQLPLALHENRDAFKMYLMDTGLLSAAMRVQPTVFFDEDGRRELDAGPLAENYVAQALVAQKLNLAYWVSKGKAEVDFVLDLGLPKAVPLEVKSSHNVRSRSLSVYREKYDPLYAIRLSTKNFGMKNGIKSVPLYAAFCIGSEGFGWES